MIALHRFEVSVQFCCALVVAGMQHMDTWYRQLYASMHPGFVVGGTARAVVAMTVIDVWYRVGRPLVLNVLLL